MNLIDEKKSDDIVKIYPQTNTGMDLELIQTLVERKDITIIEKLGGTLGIAKLLNSDFQSGLQITTSEVDQVTINRSQYGSNVIPIQRRKNIFQLMWTVMQDKILILLFILAMISLIFGLIQKFTHPSVNFEAEKNQPPEWIDGVAIIFTIIVIVLVTAGNDWKKELQFQKLNQLKNDGKTLTLIRNSQTLKVQVDSIVVGDIILLEPGDLLPVDAVVIHCTGLKCDESTVTGESDAVHKASYENIMHTSGTKEVEKYDPVLISGSKVLDGTGKVIVIAVGPRSFFGKLLLDLRTENPPTPLQIKLDELAEKIAKLGTIAALIILVSLLVLMFSCNITFFREKSQDPWFIVNKIVECFITAVTVVVVAVPEGLPLAVTVALAFATVRMLKDNNFVRVLSACETMGNATVICSDKTGTLTQNKMTVVKAVIQGQKMESMIGLSRKKGLDLPLLTETIVHNSTAFLKPQNEIQDGDTKFIGSKTECALLDLIYPFCDYESIKNQGNMVRAWPFTSDKKVMATLYIHSAHGDKVSLRYYLKGAPEFVLPLCGLIMEKEALPLDSNRSDMVLKDVEDLAKQTLRTIGIAYLNLEITKWQYEEYLAMTPSMQDAYWDSLLPSKKCTWLALVGIEDPLRLGVVEAVKDCLRAGVKVKMVTGDNILTAKSIALKCGIIEPNIQVPNNLKIKDDEIGFPVIMEGKDFRNLSELQMISILPYLRVLARSSPKDKMVLVTKLKEMQETVAVTGDGTNDGPALKAADIGFSMGISGTEVAKEASEIVLLDDNFGSIVKAIQWGRTVNDGVKKFIQFQLTVNITAVALTFTSSCYSAITLNSSNGESKLSVLTATQLLWVNLIMDSLAALALATDPPSKQVLDRRPDRKDAPLITLDMWKMILSQAVLQLIVCFSLYYGYHPNGDLKVRNTIVFNSFVLMQLFNEVNCRQINSNLNIFQGIHKNLWFLLIMLITILLQFFMVQFLGLAFDTIPLDFLEWILCIGIGALSIPLALVIRLIPNRLILGLISKSLLHPHTRKVLDPTEFDVHKHVRDQLSFRSTLRGKRADMKNSMYAMALVPSMMATSVCISVNQEKKS